MIIRTILISLTLWLTTFSEETKVNLTRKTFSSGVNYLRINLPNDSANWTCFDQDTYADIIKVKKRVIIQDSIMILQNENLAICDRNDSRFNKLDSISIESSKQYEQLIKDYKKFSDETWKKMVEAEAKKYQWGAYGFVAGMLASSILIASFK